MRWSKTDQYTYIHYPSHTAFGQNFRFYNSRQQSATVTKRITRVFLCIKNTRTIRFVTVTDCYRLLHADSAPSEIHKQILENLENFRKKWKNHDFWNFGGFFPRPNFKTFSTDHTPQMALPSVTQYI